MRTRILTHMHRLYRYALSMSRDEDAANDLVQEACVRALGAVRVPENDIAFRVWLFRIARNAHIDQIRAQKSGRVSVEEADGLIPYDPWAQETVELNRILLASGFEKLNDSQREVLTLVDILGLSYKEAASVLDVADGTIMSRVARARSALMETLSGGDVIPFRQRKNW